MIEFGKKYMVREDSTWVTIKGATVLIVDTRPTTDGTGRYYNGEIVSDHECKGSKYYFLANELSPIPAFAVGDKVIVTATVSNTLIEGTTGCVRMVVEPDDGKGFAYSVKLDSGPLEAVSLYFSEDELSLTPDFVEDDTDNEPADGDIVIEVDVYWDGKLRSIHYMYSDSEMESFRTSALSALTGVPNTEIVIKRI